MKTLLTAVGGIALSLAMFATGLVVATAFFSAEPERRAAMNMDTAGLWSSKPIRVNAQAQGFERLPDRPLSDAAERMLAVKRGGASQPAIDDTTTASTPIDATAADPAPANAAHVEWCASHYRSYNAADNTYRPYSGGVRHCVSPYGTDSDVEASRETKPIQIVYGSEQGLLTYVADDQSAQSDHELACAERYRSYRPEDNTYQPFGGGPRVVCE